MAKRTEAATRVCTDSLTFWLTAALTYAACLSCLAMWASRLRQRRRAAVAELRLRRTRIRLRTAEAELQEADEYLAAQGELLEFYEETFGPLPVNPFARGAEGEQAVAGEEWPQELTEADLRED
jgi:hypothetical protein